jgi:hypothetical protein
MTGASREKSVESLPYAVVLGAGASRSVSYAHDREQPSPLDSDFFDLLIRLEPTNHDTSAVEFVRKQIGALPLHDRRSMERSFYTIHLRAFMARSWEQLRTHRSRPKRKLWLTSHDVFRHFSGPRTASRFARITILLCGDCGERIRSFPSTTIWSLKGHCVPSRVIREPPSALGSTDCRKLRVDTSCRRL